jgi:ABC-type glycerol-3-phosphate transport system substrate-binding protein
MSKTGKTGFAVRHQMNEEPVWWIDHSNWELGYAGGWSDGENLTINSPENVQAETDFKRMYDSGAFSVGDDASTYRSKFAAGEVGMVIDNSSTLLTMVKDGSVGSDQVGASTLPFPSDGSVYAGFGIGINANSENKELAKDFLRWMFTPEAQEQLAEGLFPSSVGTDAKALEELRAQHPWVERVLRSAPERRERGGQGLRDPDADYPQDRPDADRAHPHPGRGSAGGARRGAEESRGSRQPVAAVVGAHREGARRPAAREVTCSTNAR